MRRTILSIPLLVLALVAAGCDEEKTATIGVLAPLDAGLTQFGEGIRNSVELAVLEANETNAIPGWRVRLVAVDDSSDPAVGLANIERFLDDPSVIGIVGTYNSGVAAAVLPDLEAAGIALVSPGNTNPSLTLGPDRDNPVRPYDNYFRMVAHDGQQGSFLAQSATDLGYETVSVVTDEKPVSQGLAKDFRDEWLSLGGEVLSFEVVPEGDTSYGPYAGRAADHDPDLLFFGGEYDHAALLKDAAIDEGLTSPLIGGDGIQADEYIEAVGDEAEGDLASSVGRPVELEPGGQSFLEAYEARGFAEPPSTFGPYAYDAANILIAAARDVLAGHTRVDAAIRAEILERIALTDEDDAVTGQVGFDEFGDTVHPVLTLYRVEDGSWEPVLP